MVQIYYDIKLCYHKPGVRNMDSIIKKAIETMSFKGWIARTFAFEETITGYPFPDPDDYDYEVAD